MTTNTHTTKTPKKNAPHASPPPAPPEGKPFEVGATTATVNTNADKSVTLRLKRVIHAPPERTYHAFLDPDALAAWLPPHGMVAKTHVTITLTPVEDGALVEVVQAGIPAGPAASGAPYGWSQSFEKLALLVEPELPF